MLGYDISWAGFNIIEVMSSPKFTCKRIGYLAASQCFHPEIELIMLTTNMVRKDLNSQNQFDAGVALSGLSCFISSDLARDLANDIMTLVRFTFFFFFVYLKIKIKNLILDEFNKTVSTNESRPNDV